MGPRRSRPLRFGFCRSNTGAPWSRPHRRGIGFSVRGVVGRFVRILFNNGTGAFRGGIVTTVRIGVPGGVRFRLRPRATPAIDGGSGQGIAGWSLSFSGSIGGSGPRWLSWCVPLLIGSLFLSFFVFAWRTCLALSRHLSAQQGQGEEQDPGDGRFHGFKGVGVSVSLESSTTTSSMVTMSSRSAG